MFLGSDTFSLRRRFFLDIASDSPPSDSVNHSLSFISDGNVLALHRLLWNNQERIGQYLSSNRWGGGAGAAAASPWPPLNAPSLCSQGP